LKKLIEDNEKEKVESLLEAQSLLVSFLGQDWVKNTLLSEKERQKAHFLFWLLLDPEKSQSLENWLKNIKGSLVPTKFAGLISKLKKSGGKTEFYSLLSEIEVLSYYASKNLKIEYEPSQGDIKLMIDDCEVFIEIARLFSSEEQTKLETLEHKVWDKLDELDNKKYVISFSISQVFSQSDIEPFVRFVEKKLNEEFNEFPTPDFTYSRDKARFRILAISRRNKGYVGGYSSPVMTISSARRLKAKIIDEAKQLPKGKFNVVVYNISDPFTHFDSIEDAFFGQSVAIIDLKTNEGKWARKENGVIHKEEGKRLNALIAFRHFQYDNRKKYENPMAEFQLPNEILKEL